MSVPYEEMQQDYDIPAEEEVEESPLFKYLDQGNIVGEIEDNAKTCDDIVKLFDTAYGSMKSWRKKYKRAINLAKLQPMSGDNEINEKNFPFKGASLAMMPFILEAMLDFSARAASDLVWSDDIIKAKTYGTNSEEKEDRAKRVSDYMNYQLTESIPGWREGQDKGLLMLASPGTFYKKTYYDPSINEIRSDLRLADQIIFDQGCSTFDEAAHKFDKVEYTRSEVIGFIRGDQKWDIDEEDLEDDIENFEFIEAYTLIDLDNDGLREPYIATIWKEKSKVICLYPNYDEDTIVMEGDVIVKVDPVDCFTQYKFLPDPEGGPMGLGWGILLGPMFDSINANVRQLIDSGTVSITAANSGLIAQSFASGRGNATQSGPVEVVMGQLTPIGNHGAGTLRDNIVQFPFSGPSPVLFKLMDYLVVAARQMTNSAINVEANPGEAASLYLARLQQGLKVPNSIMMRCFESARKEFKQISALNYKHFDNKKYNKVLDLEQEANMERDFNPDDCDIRTAADPSQGSDIERTQRAQAVYQLAESQTEQIISKREALLNLLESMNAPNLEKLAPEKDPNEVDPMTKLLMAEKQMEAEFRQRDQALREGELRVKEMNAAKEAAAAMAEAGLKADKTEAEIAKLYTDAQVNLYNIGISGAKARAEIKKIESEFIAEGGKSGRQASKDNSSAV